jgi:hypothetical protein
MTTYTKGETLTKLNEIIKHLAAGGVIFDNYNNGGKIKDGEAFYVKPDGYVEPLNEGLSGVSVSELLWIGIPETPNPQTVTVDLAELQALKARIEDLERGAL